MNNLGSRWNGELFRNTHLGHLCDDPSNALVQQELRKFDLVRKKRRQMGTRQYMVNAKKYTSID